MYISCHGYICQIKILQLKLFHRDAKFKLPEKILRQGLQIVRYHVIVTLKNDPRIWTLWRQTNLLGRHDKFMCFPSLRKILYWTLCITHTMTQIVQKIKFFWNDAFVKHTKKLYASITYAKQENTDRIDSYLQVCF